MNQHNFSNRKAKSKQSCKESENKQRPTFRDCQYSLCKFMWFLEGAISMLLLHSNVTKTLNKELEQLFNSKVSVKVYKKERLILLNKNVFFLSP